MFKKNTQINIQGNVKKKKTKISIYTFISLFMYNCIFSTFIFFIYLCIYLFPLLFMYICIYAYIDLFPHLFIYIFLCLYANEEGVFYLRHQQLSSEWQTKCKRFGRTFARSCTGNEWLRDGQYIQNLISRFKVFNSVCERERVHASLCVCVCDHL